MLIAAGLLLLLALVLLWWSSREQKRAGLPAGRVIYSDTTRWGKVEKPFYDADLRLTGKPDYLIAHNNSQVPVEVKSGWAPQKPYAGHLYQLAAYCLLVKKTYGNTPPYGIIHYHNRTFAIDYTAQLESDLLELVAEIRRDQGRREVSRSHEEPVRCERCGYRGICDQRL